MSQVKITFFKDSKLKVSYGALLEFDSGVTKVVYTGRDWFGNFVSNLNEGLRKAFDHGDIKFQNLEELEAV